MSLSHVRRGLWPTVCPLTLLIRLYYLLLFIGWSCWEGSRGRRNEMSFWNKANKEHSYIVFFTVLSMQHTSAAAVPLGCRFLCITLPDYASIHSLLFFVPLPCWVSLGSLPSLLKDGSFSLFLPGAHSSVQRFTCHCKQVCEGCFLGCFGNEWSRCDLSNTASFLLRVSQILFQIPICIQCFSMLGGSAARTCFLTWNCQM